MMSSTHRQPFWGTRPGEGTHRLRRLLGVDHLFVMREMVCNPYGASAIHVAVIILARVDLFIKLTGQFLSLQVARQKPGSNTSSEPPPTETQRYRKPRRLGVSSTARLDLPPVRGTRAHGMWRAGSFGCMAAPAWRRSSMICGF